MGTENGREAPVLIRSLYQDAYRFKFFQAVRLLERYAAYRRYINPAGESEYDHPVGRYSPPAREMIWFRSVTTHAFPANEIDHLTDLQYFSERLNSPFPPQMYVTFMGLTGPSGVLPHFYTRLVREADRQMRLKEKSQWHTSALHAFLDLFNHRSVSLFYRAWKKNNIAVSKEQAVWQRATPQARDDAGLFREQMLENSRLLDFFSDDLTCLIGLGTPQLRQFLTRSQTMEWLSPAENHPLNVSQTTGILINYYAGLFANTRRTAFSLEGILTEVFPFPRDRPVEIQVHQFQGGWMMIDEDDQTRLPSRHDVRESYAHLGTSFVIGTRKWDSQSAVRISIKGRYEQVMTFMPRPAHPPHRTDFSQNYQMFSQLVRLYLGVDLEVYVHLVITSESFTRPSAETQSGSDGAGGQPSENSPFRLSGRNSSDSTEESEAVSGESRQRSDSLALLGWTTFAISRPPEKNLEGLFYLLP